MESARRYGAGPGRGSLACAGRSRRDSGGRRNRGGQRRQRGAADVSGQVFAVRANEIFLMSQSRPLRSMHASEGWTPQTVAERAIPALRPNFYKLDRSQDVFDWDPV